jgi:hypothetical protein
MQEVQLGPAKVVREAEQNVRLVSQVRESQLETEGGSE